MSMHNMCFIISITAKMLEIGMLLKQLINRTGPYTKVLP